MKSNILSILAITVAAWSAGPALAADAGASLTRDQVNAELAQAQRNGDLLAHAEAGLKQNEVAPGNYPAQAALPGKTREQVRAEFAQALRSGDVPVDGVTGLKANQLAPGNYPARAAAQAASRDQVQSELSSAIRHGALPVHDSV
ncbi:MAG: DUF4148 domain-containing protein [Comamonas sp.]